MQMSLGPTYGRVSPEAIVDTITFGNPIGSARIARVTSVVPPEPPAPIRPPTSRRASMKRSNATAIALTELPRSSVKTARSPSGW
jgi:hypothetical protein